MNPDPTNWAFRSLLMFGSSLLICLISGYLLIGSGSSGMYGPSPAAGLLVLAWLLAAIFNITGIHYGKKVEDKSLRQWCTLLNSILPFVLCLLFFFSQMFKP